jgi:hypothetical protein
VSPEPKSGGGGGLSLSTLLISSLAAVAAAIVVPMFWERGSLIATAVTPVIVAVVSEMLNRPARAIQTAAPRVTRRSATGAAVRRKTPTGVGARGGGPEQLPPRDDPFGLYEPERPQRRFPLKLAVITGLLAAVIGAGVVTASELALFGHSVGQSNRSTGLFGGKARHSRTATPTPTPTETATPAETATPTATATPTQTETPTPTATPSATATPLQGAPTAAPTETAPPAATPTP